MLSKGISDAYHESSMDTLADTSADTSRMLRPEDTLKIDVVFAWSLEFSSQLKLTKFGRSTLTKFL